MMSEHEQTNDPWANLADSLGAKPVTKPASPAPAASSPPPAARLQQKPRSERPAAVRSDWGGLEAALGLPAAPQAAPSAPTGRPQAPAAQQPAAPAPRVSAPPAGNREREEDEFSFGSRRPAAEAAPPQGHESHDAPRRREPARPARHEGRHDVADLSGEPRSLDGRSETPSRGQTEADGGARSSRDDEQGEGRGRRRRGRRGGRGRGGRREEGRDRGPQDRQDDDQTAPRRPAAAREEGFADSPAFDREHLHRGPAEPVAAHGESAVDDMGESRGEPTGEGGGEGDGQPRRRRRRGRRGGRRRGRGGEREGETGGAMQPEPTGRETSRDDGDIDDEPLPAGYGVRPATRPAEPGRADTSRAEGGDANADRAGDGEGGGRRRRRRRRRGEGRSRDSRGTSSSADSKREGSATRRSGDGGSQARGRRGRRGDDRRSASTLDRGRRDEFAPVAGGREEDDEGLEFLGIEDASHDARDDRHHADDDDSIVESGLNEVLDVPSWVEAIGIVIAGNLDARSRSPRGGGGGGDGGGGRGESRGDSSTRGGGDRRRGGR